MSDIAKCEGKECPMKHTCLRYKIEGSERQLYFGHPPYDGVHCDFFIKQVEE